MNAARVAKATIKIPKRIERGPTDILKALALTVKHTTNEPEYSLQDDPFLIPRRPFDTRSFNLSKLSGIKTAKFILNKHPELFYRDDAEPKVESFLPLEQFNSDMEFSEDDIKWCIENNDVTNCIIAYKSLEERNVELSTETLLSFFEMICYCNEENLADDIDNERFRLLPKSEDQLVNLTWKTSGLASKIFNKIKDSIDPPRVYSAMIAGLTKYNEHTTATQVFDNFKENHSDKGLYPVAYDGLLRSVPNLNSSVITAHQSVDDIVRHMETHLVMPDLHIFNSILKCYRSFQCDDSTCKKAFKLINDMETLGIEPSLFTFASLVGIVCRFKPSSKYYDVITGVLDHLKSSNDKLVARDERDVQSFGNLMASISLNLNSLKLANDLHSLYLKQPNLFSTPKYRAKYLNNYFKLIITTDTLENILKFYDTYVPLSFEPSIDCYEAFIEALELYQADEDVIKKIGIDLIDFNLAKRVKNDAIFRKDPSYVDSLEKMK